jgi:hypothetical protein
LDSTVRELIPDAFDQPKPSDTWRFGSTDEGFVIHFGSWEDDETVRVHARIQIPDLKLDCFASAFARALAYYCARKGIELTSVEISSGNDTDLPGAEGEAENT